MIRTTFILLAVSSALAEIEIKEAEHSATATLNKKILWSYHHNPAEGKPYFHPLASTDGTMFTDLRPADHPWHRGLWFSWKYINGVNYWEEDRKTGKSQGETRIIALKRTISQDQQANFDLELAYAPDKSDAVVMRESRSVKVSPPDDNGRYCIDWSSTFQALDKDVILDRTPIPGEPDGQSWGGYAGLSLRMNQSVKDGVFLNNNGLRDNETNRKPARWMIFDVPEGGSILFMDHPSNFNYPSTWYTIKNMPFFTPAVVHDALHTIKAGESLRLKYRLVVAPRSLTSDAAEKEFNKIRKDI
ncbi:MAG: PmoA family protein [Kiritimatiellae bacterium]|nr:PmoA family protein [Kiritimatiellia bacterium]